MSHKRFFIDHGAIHDCMTDKHVGMQAEIDWQPRLLSLLNDMWEQIIALERAGLKAACPSNQDEYVLVPREPTDRMLSCGAIQRKSAYSSTAEIYRAMIAAAPDDVNLIAARTEPQGWMDAAIQEILIGIKPYLVATPTWTIEQQKSHFADLMKHALASHAPKAASGNPIGADMLPHGNPFACTGAGWKLVPVVKIDEAIKALSSAKHSASGWDECMGLLRAMLNAAPPEGMGDGK